MALITNIISGNDDVLTTGPLCFCSRVQKSADCRTNNKKWQIIMIAPQENLVKRMQWTIYLTTSFSAISLQQFHRKNTSSKFTLNIWCLHEISSNYSFKKFEFEKIRENEKMELRRRPNAVSSSGTVILKSIISAQNITNKDTAKT